MSLAFSLGLHTEPELPNSSKGEIRLQGSLPKTIILIHGLTGTPNEMKHLAHFFNKKGYSAICPRLANHGRPLAVLKRTRWEEFYDSVRSEFLKALETGNKVYVAGLSMSALFVLKLAGEFGPKLSGGICLSTTLRFDGWSVPWYNCFLPIAARTPFKYWLYFKEGPPYGIKNPSIRAMVHRSYSKASLKNLGDVGKFGYPFFPVSLLHQLHLLSRNVLPLLPKVEAPILLIHPREDDTANMSNSEQIYANISSKTKKLVILEDCYHVITADQERAKVAEEMESFISAL